MKIPRFFTNVDEGTWVGHYIIGLLLFWPGYGLGWLTGQGFGLDPLLTLVIAGTLGTITGLWGVVAIFGYREGDDALKAKREYGRRAVRVKGLDGIGDFLFPVLAVFADINLVAPYGGAWHFVASVVAAAIIWFMFVAKNRKGDVLSVFRQDDPGV